MHVDVRLPGHRAYIDWHVDAFGKKLQYLMLMLLGKNCAIAE